jgi:hypothetical protein
MATGSYRYVLACEDCNLRESLSSLESASVVGSLHLMETSRQARRHRTVINRVSRSEPAGPPPPGVDSREVRPPA